MPKQPQEIFFSNVKIWIFLFLACKLLILLINFLSSFFPFRTLPSALTLFCLVSSIDHVLYFLRFTSSANPRLLSQVSLSLSPSFFFSFSAFSFFSQSICLLYFVSSVESHMISASFTFLFLSFSIYLSVYPSFRKKIK